MNRKASEKEEAFLNKATKLKLHPRVGWQVSNPEEGGYPDIIDITVNGRKIETRRIDTDGQAFSALSFMMGMSMMVYDIKEEFPHLQEIV